MRFHCRRAVSIIYVTLSLPVIAGALVLTVDYGRVVCAKGELGATADAAARYAAVGMASSSTKATTAYSQAAAVCAQSKCDGQTVTISSSDVQLGIWIPLTRTFTPTANEALANSVRVSLTYNVGSGGAPLFGAAMGFKPLKVTATAIASATMISTQVTAPSAGNLWLSGAADNTSISNLQGDPTKNDNSGTTLIPKQRPQSVDLASLGIQPGDVVSFEGMSGAASYGGGSSGTSGPDGDSSYIVALGAAPASTVPNNNVNGIANVRAPISSVMALFLSNSSPSSGSTPSSLDFGTATQRDYTQLSPQLKQPFFVGDGKTSAGEVQHITVPPGATRLYLGMMDAWQWNDNTGSFTMTFYRGVSVSTVK